MSSSSDGSRVANVGQRFRVFVSRPDVLAGLIVFAVLLAVILVRNMWIFREGRYEAGDFAVNSILIDKAQSGLQLYGNYSRVGFHHPGPALLYAQAFGELIFYRGLGLVPTPFNGHALGIVIFNSTLYGVVAAVLVGSLKRRSVGVLALTAALTIGAVQPVALISTSFPEIYIAPFLLLLVSSAVVFAGAVQYLPAAAVAAGLLVHGHVSFVLFSGVFAAAIAASLYRRRASIAWRRPVLWSVAILAFFALPIALHSLLDWPGEIGNYIKYSNSPDAGGNSWADVLRFAGSYWGATSAMGYVVAATTLVAVPLVARSAGKQWSPVLYGFGLSCWLATATFLVYAKRGVDDLSYRYVGEYYLTVPVVIVLALSLLLLTRLAERPAHWMIGVAAAMCVVLATAPNLRDNDAGVPWLPDAERAVSAAAGDRTQVVRFEVPVWHWAAGVVEQSRRSGHNVCIEDPEWAFLFDSSMVCDADEVANGVVVSYVAPDEELNSDLAQPAYSNELVHVLVDDSAD